MVFFVQNFKNEKKHLAENGRLLQLQIAGRWFFNCKKEKWYPFGWKLRPLLSEVLDIQDSCIFKVININSLGNWYAHCLAICRQRLFY